MIKFNIEEITKLLSEKGMPEDNIEKVANSLCAAHTAGYDRIVDENHNLKEKVEKYDDMEKQLKKAESDRDSYKKQAETSETALNEEKTAHDKLKSDIAAKETTANRLKGFKNEAQKRGCSDEAVKRYLDSRENYPLDKIKYDDSGNATNYDDVFKKLDEVFPNYAVERGVDRHTPSTPPQSNTSGEKKTSRAAEIAAKFHSNLYGEKKEG